MAVAKGAVMGNGNWWRGKGFGDECALILWKLAVLVQVAALVYDNAPTPNRFSRRTM